MRPGVHAGGHAGHSQQVTQRHGRPHGCMQRTHPTSTLCAHGNMQVLGTVGLCTLDMLLTPGPFDELSAVFVAASIVCGLEHLHWSHVIYRGLSVHSVVVTEGGQVRRRSCERGVGCGLWGVGVGVAGPERGGAPRLCRTHAHCSG